MQDQLEQLNANMEKLVEQIRIANQQRFGRHSERLDVINLERMQATIPSLKIRKKLVIRVRLYNICNGYKKEVNLW